MHLDLALAPAFGGNQPSESPLVLMLACFFVCRGQEKACGGICMRFMLCLLNLKWQDFLALLEVGAAVGVHPVHGLVQLRSANASVNSTLLDPLLHFPDAGDDGFRPVTLQELSQELFGGNASLASAPAPRTVGEAISARMGPPQRPQGATRPLAPAPTLRPPLSRPQPEPLPLPQRAAAVLSAAIAATPATPATPATGKHPPAAAVARGPAAARRRGGCTGAGAAALRRRGRAGGWGRRRGAPTSRC